MHISFVDIQNFRKLKSCRIDLAKTKTVFVGPNNSGKTSAMDALIIFLKKREFSTRDFTLSNWIDINQLGKTWIEAADFKDIDLTMSPWEKNLPSLDLWIHVGTKQLHHVMNLIPSMEWTGGYIGVRLRYEPENIVNLYEEFASSYSNARTVSEGTAEFNLWPADIWSFLDKKGKLQEFFTVRSYLLDPGQKDTFQPLPANSIPLQQDFLKGLIKVDIINAQRGFSDANTEGDTSNVRNLSNQLRSYYDKHLNPSKNPTKNDVKALKAIQDAKLLFDQNLEESFESAIGELKDMNYPGFGNPAINLSSRIETVDSLNHESSVLYSLMGDNPKLSLPEKYNGLGYQNLISMIFKLIRFRDEWMQVGKSYNNSKRDEVEFEPVHLVLIEEPEAHLHAQVQQVFIREAYNVLRRHSELKSSEEFVTQLVVSTHSNHIAHEIEFIALRYFKRNIGEKGAITTSSVENLSTVFGNESDTTKFAIRYLKTTHCDLFFADALILVEGPVERMLIPHFIELNYKELHACYLSILEIGGSHAHTLLPLIEKLGIITLIVTDLDSVEATGLKQQPALKQNLKTNNETVKELLQKATIDDLIALAPEAKEVSTHPIKVAYQISLDIGKPVLKVIPYTFEESLVMENKPLFSSLPKSTGLLQKMIAASQIADTAESAKAMFDVITAKGVKKAEFALELLYIQDPSKLKIPKYIEEGFKWLEEKLKKHKDGINPKV